MKFWTIPIEYIGEYQLEMWMRNPFTIGVA